MTRCMWCGVEGVRFVESSRRDIPDPLLPDEAIHLIYVDDICDSCGHVRHDVQIFYTGRHDKMVLFALDPAIDDAFARFYRASSVSLMNIKDEAMAFFDRHPVEPQLQDFFFTNFTPLFWRPLMQERKWAGAENLWSSLLEMAVSWETLRSPSRVHKGTPYYFWSMAAILSGAVDRGYSLMHQAAEEDRLTSQVPLPPSPTYAFITMDVVDPHQAFLHWVHVQSQYVETRLSSYQSSRSGSLGFSDLRTRFLLDVPRLLDPVLLFGHVTARLTQWEELPEHARTSGFAAQLELNLLSDLLLVVEELIREKNPTKSAPRQPVYFSDQLGFLAAQVGLSIAKPQLTTINNDFKGDPDATVRALLDGTHTPASGTRLPGIESDLALALCLRNHAAHSVLNLPVISERFPDVRQAFYNVLFLVVEKLYP